MGDNLKRGFDFATAEGLQSGEDLEDLLTKAELVNNDGSANRLYDDLSVNLNADASPKLQVKDGGITTAKLADGAVTADKLGTGAVLGGPIITEAKDFDNIAQTGWTVNPVADLTDLAELVNEDNVIVTTVGTVAQDAIAFVEFDLGAVFNGTIKLKFDARVTNGAGRWVVSPAANEVQAAWNTDAVHGAVHTLHLIDDNTVFRTYGAVTTFSGQFVGFYFSNSDSSGVCSIQLRRLEIHGVAE